MLKHTQPSATNPIAVFDSGMGGISVLREMVKLMPHEDFVYLGDSKNAPYGTKSLELVRQLTIDNIHFLVENYHCKAAAVACNTATSAAVRILREMHPDFPLVGVEPALKPAALAKKNAKVLVMATPMTLREEKFRQLEHRFDSHASIYSLPCPGLMEYVEQGILSGEELASYLHERLEPYRGQGITGIVLGCTHYPFLRNAIREIVGESVEIYDGGLGTARELLRRLKEADLCREDNEHEGQVTFLNSSDDPELLERSKDLFYREL